MPYDHSEPAEQLQAGEIERLALAGSVEQACELAKRCAVPASRMQGLRAALGSKILDGNVPSEPRLLLVRHAQSLFPGLVAELRREHGLAGRPLPDPAAWAALARPDQLMASLTAAPDLVRSALGAADVPTVMTALEVVRELAYMVPDEAGQFAAAVRSLCRDRRFEPPPIATRLCARARNVHALLFAGFRGTGAWEALLEVIDAMVSAGLGVSLGPHFRSLGVNGISVERVGALLVERVADRGRPAKERLQAREVLSALAAEAAANRPNGPYPCPEGRAAAVRADDLLVAALTDPSEAEDFKAGIRAGLTRWMPDRIPSLQGNAIPRTPVPSISDLQMGQSIAEIDRDEVVSLLRDPGVEPGRLLSAIALAEWLARLAPGLAVELESSLRALLADGRRYADRSRNLTVGIQAQYAHRAVWRLLGSGAHPSGPELLASLRKIAAAQAAPAAGEDSRAAELAETICAVLVPADLELTAAALEADLADRRLSAWPRLHSYLALARLWDQATRADKALFAALADPGEDPVLRTEAHSLLAPRMALPVHQLQERGLLPHPIVPRAETLFHNVPLFDRDTEGEWTLTPDAIKLGHLVFPEDLLAVLREPEANPSRACAAAALAAVVARRLPSYVEQLARALRTAMGCDAEFRAGWAGRERTFRLAELCSMTLRELGLPEVQAQDP